MSDLYLRRKWTFRAHGRQIVLAKRSNEKTTHVLMKAFLWALYLPEYPDLKVEVPIGDRYKPDVVALDDQQTPLFWGESGEVSMSKIRSLARRYRGTRFAVAKWDPNVDRYVSEIKETLEGLARTGLVEVLGFPRDAERFIDGTEIRISFDDVERVRL